MKKWQLLFFVYLAVSLFLYSEDFFTHKVKEKETLWSISKKYGVPLEVIVTLNKIKDITAITTGMELKIPTSLNKSESSLDNYEIYTFKKGDTLWQISRKYGVSVNDILKINNISSPEAIKEGMKIKVRALKNEENFIEHTVKKGENLFRISKIYNVTVKDIEKLNNLSDQSIKEGMVLKIKKENFNKNDKEEIGEIKKEIESNFIIHKIQEKETLWSISKSYKVTVDEIKAINGFSNTTIIKKGMNIKIPAKIDYLEYDMPLDGEVEPFKSSHFSGLYIYGTANSREVKSIDKGIVSYVDTVPGFGQTVFIRHNDDYISTYSGFKKIFVKEGDILNKNDIIGEVSDTTDDMKNSILFSIQYKGVSLKFDKKEKKFIKNSY